MFRVEVNGNQARLVQREPITSGSVQAYLMEFSFSEEWSELDRVAVFKTGDNIYDIPLDETNQCFIPWEVMTEPNVQIQFGIYGARGTEIVLPTVWVPTDTILEGVVTGIEANEPTVTLTGQLIEEVNSLNNRVKQLEDQGPGPKGDDGFSPTVEIAEINDGHSVTITDVNGPQTFDVMDGKDCSSKTSPMLFTGYAEAVPKKGDTDTVLLTQFIGKEPEVSTDSYRGILWVKDRLYYCIYTVKSIADDSAIIEYADVPQSVAKENDIYSADHEVRIGTWIDGKPVYRKVVTGYTYPYFSKWFPTGATIPDIDLPIRIYGYIINNWADETTPYTVIPITYREDDYVGFVSLNVTKNGDVVARQNLSTYASKEMRIIVEYTKITDSPKT